MKRIIVLIIIILFLVLFTFASTGDQDDVEKSRDVLSSSTSPAHKFAKGSVFLTGQIGMASFVATDEPVERMPFPLEGGIEFMMSDHLGFGGSVMFERWSDYLGLFGGKYNFSILRPALDLTYHFLSGDLKGLDLFARTSLGYSLLSVSNELGNDYDGTLKSEPHLSLNLGTHLFFWEGVSAFFDRLLVTVNVGWSVFGEYSGFCGSVGLTIKIK
ncbi:hypothetical protein ACFLT9_01920 [Acidobacteriota bacterium]